MTRIGRPNGLVGSGHHRKDLCLCGREKQASARTCSACRSQGSGYRCPSCGEKKNPMASLCPACRLGPPTATCSLCGDPNDSPYGPLCSQCRPKRGRPPRNGHPVREGSAPRAWGTRTRSNSVLVSVACMLCGRGTERVVDKAAPLAFLSRCPHCQGVMRAEVLPE